MMWAERQSIDWAGVSVAHRGWGCGEWVGGAGRAIMYCALTFFGSLSEIAQFLLKTGLFSIVLKD